MLNVMIVDDEPLSRENVSCLLRAYSEMNIVAECSNAVEAIGHIHRLRPDVVFLDIHMPRISGLEMVNMIDPDCLPHIVFLTAYDHYAVQAFEQRALDYLLKPIDPIRLHKTIERLCRECEPQKRDVLLQNDVPLNYIPCVGHSKIYLTPLNDVLFINSRAAGNYVTTCDGQEYFTELTLRTLEERTHLIRCHRQYLVNIQQLKEIRFHDSGQTDMVLRGGTSIPVSRRHFKNLKTRLSL